MLPAAQAMFESSSNKNNTVLVKLQVNQLAGTIPTWLHSLPSGDIDVLEGNLFSCNADRSDLPANDPKAATYECGSDNTNYGLIAFGAALVCVSMLAAVNRFCMILGSSIGSVVGMMVSFKNRYGRESEVRKLWENIERAVYVIVGMWMLGMLVYGLLSMQFSSYADVYVWAVSAIFTNGLASTVSLFLWFGLLVSLISVLVNFYCDKSLKNMSSIVHLFKSITLKKTSMLLVVFLCNTVIVTFVNGLYVYFVVSKDYEFDLLFIIASLLSLFKIAWNYVLLSSSQYVEEISDNIIVLLCLFNNLLAPLLAELFVSSDCFLYIVSKAPALIFNFDVYSCQLEVGTRFVENICNVAVLAAQGYGIVVEASINPPFHYSYQCSYALISSYTYVFIFRYIITGLLEPTIRMIVFYFSHTTHNGMIRTLLPLMWQTTANLESSLDNMDLFASYIQNWQVQIETGRYRRRQIALFTTDLSMLICFGALFPPLAVIIALSILKDVMSIRLALEWKYNFIKSFA
jgi:hypothetical protein